MKKRIKMIIMIPKGLNTKEAPKRQEKDSKITAKEVRE